MRWWWRAHTDLASCALVVFGVAGVALWGGSEMPVVRIGWGPAPYLVLLPAIAAAGIVGWAGRGHTLAEARSARPTGALARIAALALTGLAAALCVAALAGRGDTDLGLAAARNTLGYTGIGLAAGRLVGGRTAPALPVLYATFAAVLGSSRGHLAWWPMLDAGRLDGTVAAAVLFAVGVALGTGRSAARATALRAGGLE